MDLIFMNLSKEDLGVLLDYEMDMAFGSGENDFETKLQAKSHCCKEGYFLYMEGTEYGGIVDNIMSDTTANEVVYSGRTWHGILNSKVLEPDAGEAYLTVSGEANAVIASLLSRMGLSDLFEASSENSGLTVSNYQMNRYIKGYDGIMKMLKTVGGKLLFRFNGGKVILSATAIYDYAQDEEFDSDLMEFKLKKKYKTVNHLICLGTGELENRTVIHLYADVDGNISQTQTQFGMDEYTDVYDYSSVESEEELISSGTDYLKSLWGQDELSVAFDDTSDSYNIGDKVGAVENITGLAISAIITKKIVTIKNGQTTISYEVGE